jgi:hypothetical protein
MPRSEHEKGIRAAALGKDFSLADIARAGQTIMTREAVETYRLNDFLTDVQMLIQTEQEVLSGDEANTTTEPLLQRLIPYAENVIYGKPAEQIWMNNVFSAAIEQKVGKGSEFQLICGKVNDILGTALEVDRRGLYNAKQKSSIRATLGLPPLTHAPKFAPAAKA